VTFVKDIRAASLAARPRASSRRGRARRGWPDEDCSVRSTLLSHHSSLAPRFEHLTRRFPTSLTGA
jgi:hypothetical protein